MIQNETNKKASAASKRAQPKLIHEAFGKKTYQSNLSPTNTLEKTATQGYHNLVFIHHDTDYKGNHVHTQLTIRNVGDNNPEAQIQLSVDQNTTFEKTNRTRKEYISFSIPADMASIFLKAANEIEA